MPSSSRSGSIHGQCVYVNFPTAVPAFGVTFFHPHTPRSTSGALTPMLMLSLDTHKTHRSTIKLGTLSRAPTPRKYRFCIAKNEIDFLFN